MSVCECVDLLGKGGEGVMGDGEGDTRAGEGSTSRAIREKRTKIGIIVGQSSYRRNK